MDPDMTLQYMRAALADGDYVTAGECAENLDEWICGGGFLPVAWRA